MSTNTAKPLTFRFIDVETDLRLELSNDADHALKCVEILTVFLKDLETPGGGPSQAHIRFDAVSSIRPKENVVLSHKTWVNGFNGYPLGIEYTRCETLPQRPRGSEGNKL